MSKLDTMAPTVSYEQVNSIIFSRVLFACRFFTGAALVYLALGSLLYWREFMVNAASFGPAFSVPLAFLLTAAELFVGLFLLLGWHTRLNAGAALLLGFVCAIIFFAGQYNHVFVALCLLLCAPLSVLAWLGPGAISLDAKRSQRAVRRLFQR